MFEQGISTKKNRMRASNTTALFTAFGIAIAPGTDQSLHAKQHGESLSTVEIESIFNQQPQRPHSNEEASRGQMQILNQYKDNIDNLENAIRHVKNNEYLGASLTKPDHFNKEAVEFFRHLLTKIHILNEEFEANFGKNHKPDDIRVILKNAVQNTLLNQANAREHSIAHKIFELNQFFNEVANHYKSDDWRYAIHTLLQEEALKAGEESGVSSANTAGN